jgi:hypothetical protein
LTAYVAYYSRSRTHLALNKDAPISRMSRHRTMETSSRFRKSAAYTIGTNAAA